MWEVLNILQALSFWSVFLTFLQSANGTEHLSSCSYRAKKPPCARGCPAERAGEGEWEQSNTTLSPLFLYVTVVSVTPPSSPPECPPIFIPRAGFLLLISLSAGISCASLFLYSMSLMYGVDAVFWRVFFSGVVSCFCPSEFPPPPYPSPPSSSFLCAGPSGTNIIIGSIAGAILLAAIVLGGTGWGFK